jgi:hypothetical protein
MKKGRGPLAARPPLSDGVNQRSARVGQEAQDRSDREPACKALLCTFEGMTLPAGGVPIQLLASESAGGGEADGGEPCSTVA